ncbi:MAG: hypothetical protein NTW01_03560 [Gammaproteobacteria bacterium]|nr:hypothetical protein [Gammaproteobacteria bacterium]
MGGKKKAVRMFLHLGESLASQVQDRASTWGLKENEAVKQLIHLGLRATTSGAHGEVGIDPRHEYLRAMLAEMLYVQVQTLLYQREAAADVPGGAASDSRTQRLSELDAKVKPDARAAAKRIREHAESIAADRAEQTSSGISSRP